MLFVFGKISSFNEKNGFKPWIIFQNVNVANFY